MKLATIALVVCLAGTTSGCRIYVQSEATVDLARLDEVVPSDVTRTDMDVLLGGPQGQGVYLDERGRRSLNHYQSMKGWVSLTGSARLDSGFGFAAFGEDELLEDLLYVRTEFDGPTLSMGDRIDLGEVLARIELGVTPIEIVTEALGEPAYVGARFSRHDEVEHRMVFYDGSGGGSQQTRTQWLFVGTSEDGVIRDLLWASSEVDDFDAARELQSTRLRNRTTVDFDGFLWVNRVESVSTSLRLDPVQVDGLLRTEPTTIEDFTGVLGAPTARGEMAFEREVPLQVALWRAEEATMLGSEAGPQIGWKKSSGGGATEPPDVGYQIVRARQSILLVAHTREGEVRRVIWARPTVSG